jgi:hypothetical protein
MKRERKREGKRGEVRNNDEDDGDDEILKRTGIDELFFPPSCPEPALSGGGLWHPPAEGW